MHIHLGERNLRMETHVDVHITSSYLETRVLLGSSLQKMQQDIGAVLGLPDRDGRHVL